MNDQNVELMGELIKDLLEYLWSKDYDTDAFLFGQILIHLRDRAIEALQTDYLTISDQLRRIEALLPHEPIPSHVAGIASPGAPSADAAVAPDEAVAVAEGDPAPVDEAAGADDNTKEEDSDDESFGEISSCCDKSYFCRISEF
jgi:hypothetical protein